MNNAESPKVGAVPEEVLLTIADAAAKLGVSRPYASMLCDTGKLGEVVTAEDGRRRVHASAVEEYLAAREKQTEGAPSPREAGVDAGLYDYPDGHDKRAADLMAEMPGGLPRVQGWEEKPAVGREVHEPKDDR